MRYRSTGFGGGFGGGGGSAFGFGFQLTPWVKRLLIANIAVFFLFILLDFAGLGGLWYYLALVPERLLVQPWGVVTYMFIHAGFWHLFGNMLGLFFFGPPLEATWGSREFLKFYLISGLGGAALSGFFAFEHPVVGASAAVFGVMLAFAMNWPESPIYIWGIFPVKAKWLVMILAGFTLFSAIGGGGAGGGVAHFAHLGGFAAAFLYLRFGDDVGMRWRQMKRRVSGPKLRVVSDEDDAPKRPARRTPTRRRSEERLLDEVDRVLDKISAEGLSSLTPEERRVLDEVSRKYKRD